MSGNHSTSIDSSARRTWESIRNDFPILDQTVQGKPLVYLDNAATSQKPIRVMEALTQYYSRDNANVHRGLHELSHRATVAYEAARERAAAYVHAPSPNEIVFTRGTTEAVNLVAQTWARRFLKPGEAILLTEMEHHSNLVPWQILAEEKGLRLKWIPVTGDEGLLDLGSLDELLRDGVRFFSFNHISNSLGTVNPVKELCSRARAHGVTTFVDAAQSGGHCPLDVQEIGCDFLAVSGHKMCGPTGIGFLYGREELLNQMPPYHGGGEMIEFVDFKGASYKKAPHRFEAGTPNIADAIGLHVAMDYLDEIGRERIWDHDQELAVYAYERLRAMGGVRLFGPPRERAGLVSFLLNDVHAHDVVTFANEAGLALRGGHHCTQPLMKKLGVASTARASFYFYNTQQEVDRMMEILLSIQKFFA